MKLTKLKSIFATWLLTSAFTSVANANVYNLVDFNLTFNEATSLVGTLETYQTGTFNTEMAIEDFLNSSKYSVILSNGNNQILNLNNSNSAWDLVFSFEPNNQTTSASLIADSKALTLSFGTPEEATEVRLFLRNSTFGYMSYGQFGYGTTGFNFFDTHFDPMTNAFSSPEYGSSFILPAVTPVPEPSNFLLFLCGLTLLSLLGVHKQALR